MLLSGVMVVRDERDSSSMSGWIPVDRKWLKKGEGWWRKSTALSFRQGS